jgi:hypothetical protein
MYSFPYHCSIENDLNMPVGLTFSLGVIAEIQVYMWFRLTVVDSWDDSVFVDVTNVDGAISVNIQPIILF